MGDRVWLETATLPVLGKETWAGVSLPQDRSHPPLSSAGKRKGGGGDAHE